MPCPLNHCDAGALGGMFRGGAGRGGGILRRHWQCLLTIGSKLSGVPWRPGPATTTATSGREQRPSGHQGPPHTPLVPCRANPFLPNPSSIVRLHTPSTCPVPTSSHSRLNSPPFYTPSHATPLLSTAYSSLPVPFSLSSLPSCSRGIFAISIPFHTLLCNYL